MAAAAAAAAAAAPARGAWDLTVSGALIEKRLRVARALPHSDLARAHALVSLAAPRPSLSVSGAQVLRVMYQSVMEAVIDRDSTALAFARIGYNVNHPGRHLDPTTFDLDNAVGATYEYRYEHGRAATVAVPSFTPLPTADLERNTQTPTNPGRSSCFTDTPFVLMFLGTDRFDALLTAPKPPDWMRIAANESRLALTTDDIDDVCSYDGGNRDNVIENMRTSARIVAWRMRSRTTRLDDVLNAIAQFRRDVSTCIKDASMACGEGDAFTIYETLLLFTGWSRWYTAPIVAIDMRTEINHSPVSPPVITSVATGAPRVWMKLGLRSRRKDAVDETTHAGEEDLQELVRYTLGLSAPIENEISPDSWSDILKTRRASDNTVKSALDKMVTDAIPVFRDRAQTEVDWLMSLEGAAQDVSKIHFFRAGHIANLPLAKQQALTKSFELYDWYRPREESLHPDEEAYRVAEEVYRETLGATRYRASVRVHLWRDLLLEPLQQQIRATEVTGYEDYVRIKKNMEYMYDNYKKSAAATARILKKMSLSTTTKQLQYVPVVPSAGVFVLDASSFRPLDASVPAMPTRINWPSRIVNVPIGPPGVGGQQDVPFRIFAVMMGGIGHYWGYLWDKAGTLYHYNDVEPEGRVLYAVQDVEAEHRKIETGGLYYMLETVLES
jgi:hypothetical protein